MKWVKTYVPDPAAVRVEFGEDGFISSPDEFYDGEPNWVPLFWSYAVMGTRPVRVNADETIDVPVRPEDASRHPELKRSTRVQLSQIERDGLLVGICGTRYV